MKVNIVLADCEKEELEEFIKGLHNATGLDFPISTMICNGSHGGLKDIWRYIVYAFYPVRYVFTHKKYNYIIAWQQFYALFYVLYCEILHIKKDNIVVACNFTYKEKKGIIGKLYKIFIRRCVRSSYLDYIHVPSRNYAKICSKEFDVPFKRFVVSNFGLPDTYDQWADSSSEYQNYSFAIGRSNRDFNFLVKTWKLMPREELLVIASDTYKPPETLPKNIILRDDIAGDDQFPLIANCKLMIIPIQDGTICSGDTVLLKAMSYHKPLIVTTPSTLSEMYVENGVNGITVEKNIDKFADTLIKLLSVNEKLVQLGERARKSYEENFSRISMGENIGKAIFLVNPKV